MFIMKKKKGRGSQWIFKMQIACDLLECLIKKKPMIALGVIYISISIPMPKKKGVKRDEFERIRKWKEIMLSGFLVSLK